MLYLQKETSVIKNACLEAGNIVLNFFTEKNFDITMKSPNNPLTEADIACNNILIKHIRENFPNDAIISEEMSEQESIDYNLPNRLTSNRIWIIDPIDGTKEFVEGIPQFAISIGFLYNGQLELGFIYNPANNFFVYGGKEMGIFYNNKSFTPSEQNINSFKDMRLSLSRTETKKGLFAFLDTEIDESKKTIIGSIAYKLGLLVVGQVDLILSLQPKNEWDIAGGGALLRAFDYFLLDEKYVPITFNKKDLKTNGLIAGTKKSIELYKKINKN